MQKLKTLFDVIGPVIIGPSSSHTAGAVRIGYVAGKIFGETPQKITFKLYNSFAKTGKGHGTDKGLLSGVLGYNVDNADIKNIFKVVENSDINIKFEYYQDSSRHPNSVDIILENNNNKMEISGMSLGGAEISINKINGYNFNIDGNYTTLLLIYKDKPGMINRVTKIIQDEGINIASMSCERKAKGEEASMKIYLDAPLKEKSIEELKKINEIYFVRNLEVLK